MNSHSEGRPARKIRKLRTDVRRRQIAQEALDLISTGGLRAVNMTTLARRVGLVPSAIYRHFGSREEVVDAALELIHDRLVGNLSAVAAETVDPVQRLRRLLLRHMETIRENQSIPRLVFSEETYHGAPERKRRVGGIVRGYLKRIAGIVREGQRTGAIRADLDPATVSLMFLGIVQPAGILWYLTEGRFDVARHTRRAWTLFHDAIRAR